MTYTYIVYFEWDGSYLPLTQRVYNVANRADACKVIKDHYGKVKILSAKRCSDE